MEQITGGQVQLTVYSAIFVQLCICEIGLVMPCESGNALTSLSSSMNSINTLTNPLVPNPPIAEKTPKQMESVRQNKSKHLGFNSERAGEDYTIQFGASACASLLRRKRSGSRTAVNEPPVCLGRHQTRLSLYNVT